MKKILITGALGQIGSELALELAKKYGQENIICSDIRIPEEKQIFQFEQLNVCDTDAITHIVKKHNINTIFHLAALLSATGEKNPDKCWDVNINGLRNILEVTRIMKLRQLICVSSIAVFGETTPKQMTPQNTIMSPSTMYGITKLTGELLCDYYIKNYNLDIRGIRYPGLISHKTLPGGGTTDYAVEIFYSALKEKKYDCFLKADTILPMMYMPDAVRGTIELAEAPNLSSTNFNFASMSISCADLANEIKKHIPEFEITYNPDYRQEIANSWPSSIDDSCAQKEWNWKPQYGIEEMTKDMLEKLTQKLA